MAKNILITPGTGTIRLTGNTSNNVSTSLILTIDTDGNMTFTPPTANGVNYIAGLGLAAGIIAGTTNQITATHGGDDGQITFSLPSTVVFPGSARVAGAPTDPTDLTNKSYVDALIPTKTPVRVLSNTNITVSNPGTTTFDSVNLSNGDRILLVNQTDPTQNGIYIFNGSSSAMTRSTDFDLWTEILSALIPVRSGTSFANSLWMTNVQPGGTIDSTAISFKRIDTTFVAPTPAGIVASDGFTLSTRQVVNADITSVAWNKITGVPSAILAIGSLAVQNGVSIAGTTITLGQDLSNASNDARLISHREIPLNAFNILFTGSSGNIVIGGTDSDDNGSRLQVYGTMTVGGSGVEAVSDGAFNGSFAAGYFAKAIGIASHAFGVQTLALGSMSSAEGLITAAGNQSHAEGWSTIAGLIPILITAVTGEGTTSGSYTGTALGSSVIVDQIILFVDSDAQFKRYRVTAINSSDEIEVEIVDTGDELMDVSSEQVYAYVVSGSTASAHAEGFLTKAIGISSHAEGNSTRALGDTSHSEGDNTLAQGANSHAQGFQSQALESESHAEGISTIAAGQHSHAEGNQTISFLDSHAEGYDTVAGPGSHAEGVRTRSGVVQYVVGSVDGSTSTIIGTNIAVNLNPGDTVVFYNTSTEEKLIVTVDTIIDDDEFTVLEENLPTGSTGFLIYHIPNIGSYGSAHSEGKDTLAQGEAAHAEGDSTSAIGDASHSEGMETSARGNFSHAGGVNSIARDSGAWARSSGMMEGNADSQVVILTMNSGGTVLFGTNTAEIRVGESGASIIIDEDQTTNIEISLVAQTEDNVSFFSYKGFFHIIRVGETITIVPISFNDYKTGVFADAETRIILENDSDNGVYFAAVPDNPQSNVNTRFTASVIMTQMMWIDSGGE